MGVSGMGVSGMSRSGYAILEARGVLKVEGPDTRPFLQGLISNDINKASPSRAIYATFLTPQGRYLHDFFIAELSTEMGGALLLDCEAARLDDLKRRLSLFKLRSNVTITAVGAAVGDGFAVAAIFGDGIASKLGLPAQAGAAKEWQGGVVFVDPRLAEAGARAILPRASAAQLLEQAGFAA